MLIRALCDYYDILAKAGKVVPQGYSKQDISYLVALNVDGTLEEIVDYRISELVQKGKGKTKEVKNPRTVLMPLPATNPSKIAANGADCRPNYIFGVSNTDKEKEKSKARQAHDDFVRVNKALLEKLECKSPVVEAFSNFLEKWNPEAEQENDLLVNLGKELNTRKFAFCLAGHPDELLHGDKDFASLLLGQMETSGQAESLEGMCAVCGDIKNIARLHNKIKNVYGGQSSGTSLVCFNNTSEESYGAVQSYNSCISEDAMRQYTEAFNILMADKNHHMLLDDTTVVYWAMNTGKEEEVMLEFLNPSGGMDEEETEKMLTDLLEDARDGKVVRERINDLGVIRDNVDFYIVGIKPNASRLSVKFMERKVYGELLQNIAQFQLDMQIGDKGRPVPLWRIKKELLSPKSTNDKIDPSLLARLFDIIVNGRPLPGLLLGTVIKRIRTDTDLQINSIRAGLIRAYLNRKSRAMGQKEEIGLSLDINSKNQAYLCGRLFAVLERIQQQAAGGVELNRTIKDAYFSSAASMPSVIFAKLMQLSQHHLKKVGNTNKGAQVNLNKLTGEIMDGICGEFPATLSLHEQGKFIIGYYHQRQDFYKKSTAKENIVKEAIEEE